MTDWLPVALIALALLGLCLGTIWRMNAIERASERNHQRRMQEIARAREQAVEEVRREMGR